MQIKHTKQIRRHSLAPTVVRWTKGVPINTWQNTTVIFFIHLALLANHTSICH